MTAIKRARLAAALWGGFLFAVTSWPHPPEIHVGGFSLDKLTHFLLYAVEAFLLYRAIAWPGNGFAWSRVLAVVGVMAVWGGLDEVHQEWIPGRRMDGADLLADIAGAVVGASAAGLSSRSESLGRRPRRDRRG